MSPIWKPVTGFDRYEVSNEGQVRNKATGKILATCTKYNGYLCVRLYTEPGVSRQVRVHRLVLEAFVGPATVDTPICRHLDNDPANNNLDNLTWGTHYENWQDRQKAGTCCLNRSGRLSAAC